MGVQVDLQLLGDATEKQVPCSAVHALSRHLATPILTAGLQVAQLAAVLSTIEGRHAQLVRSVHGTVLSGMSSAAC